MGELSVAAAAGLTLHGSDCVCTFLDKLHLSRFEEILAFLSPTLDDELMQKFDDCRPALDEGKQVGMYVSKSSLGPLDIGFWKKEDEYHVCLYLAGEPAMVARARAAFAASKAAGV